MANGSKSVSKDMPATAAEPMSDKERQIEWQTEDDLRAMTRAQEVLEDSTRAKRVMALAQEQADETTQVVVRLKKSGLISDKQANKMKEKAKSDDR